MILADEGSVAFRDMDEGEEQDEDSEGSAGRMISRFQLARPAVELSFLDQIILTPPVAAVRDPISPDAR